MEEMMSSIHDEALTELLSDAWSNWKPMDSSAPNFAAAESQFRLAASKDSSGKSEFLLAKFLFERDRASEAKLILEKSYDKGFIPAFI